MWPFRGLANINDLQITLTVDFAQLVARPRLRAPSRRADAPGEEKRGVTVRRRVAPPPAVSEPYVILFESYGSSVQVALVMGTMHHVVTRQVNQGQVHQPVVGAMAVPVMHL